MNEKLISDEEFARRKALRAQSSPEDQKALDFNVIIASRRGERYTVRDCLDQGADPDAKDYNGKSAIELAGEKNYPATVGMLVKGRADARVVLLNAIDDGNSEIVEAILFRRPFLSPAVQEVARRLAVYRRKAGDIVTNSLVERYIPG